MKSKKNEIPHIKNRLRSRNGSALAIVLIIIGVISIIMTTMISASWQRMKFTKNDANRDRAVAIAEAGVCRAYHSLTVNPSLTNSPNLYQNVDYAGGRYSVGLEVTTNSVFVITGSGNYQDQSASVAINVCFALYAPGLAESSDGSDNSIVLLPPTAGAAPCAILAGDLISILGGSYVDVGDYTIHSNGTGLSIKILGGSVIYAELISAVGSILLNKYDGVTIEGADEIAFPDFDPLRFELWAEANNAHIEGGDVSAYIASLPPSTNILGGVDVPGGVLYVEGKCIIGTDAFVNAMVIASGDIIIHGTINAPMGYPSVVSTHGEIVVNADAAIISDGWIYSMEDRIILNGGAIGDCPVLAATDVRIAGSYVLNIANLDGPDYPPEGGDTGDDEAGGDDSIANADILMVLYCLAWSK